MAAIIMFMTLMCIHALARTCNASGGLQVLCIAAVSLPLISSQNATDTGEVAGDDTPPLAAGDEFVEAIGYTDSTTGENVTIATRKSTVVDSGAEFAVGVPSLLLEPGEWTAVADVVSPSGNVPGGDGEAGVPDVAGPGFAVAGVADIDPIAGAKLVYDIVKDNKPVTDIDSKPFSAIRENTTPLDYHGATNVQTYTMWMNGKNLYGMTMYEVTDVRLVGQIAKSSDETGLYIVNSFVYVGSAYAMWSVSVSASAQLVASDVSDTADNPVASVQAVATINIGGVFQSSTDSMYFRIDANGSWCNAWEPCTPS